MTAGLLIPANSEASACATEPGELYLANFWGPGDVGSQFYAAAENAGAATATIRPWPGDCLGRDTQGTYETTDGTAVAPEDYTHTEGLTPRMCDDIHDGFCGPYPTQAQPNIPIADDPNSEAAVESLLFRIAWGEHGLADPPLRTSAPVHVVDNDGLERFSLEPTIDGLTAVAYSRSEAFPSLAIPVFRAGPAAAAASIAYNVTDGTAQRGTDYEVPPSGTITFGAGQRVATLSIQILTDGEIEGPQTFQVALTGPEAVDPKTTMVTIIDIDSDDIPPVTRFHHPRQGWKYRYGDYRIREMHVFFEDRGDPPSGVVAVEMALRKKRLDGSCKWWANSKWNSGSCDTKVWIPMKFDFDLYLKRFTPPLSPSMGTRIKNYTAWCRGIDGAGNVEASFAAGRNWNTFEVRPR